STVAAKEPIAFVWHYAVQSAFVIPLRPGGSLLRSSLLEPSLLHFSSTPTRNMRIIRRSRDVGASSLLASLLVLSTFGSRPVQGADVLKTNGFTTCLVTDDIKVTRMNIEYDRKTNEVTFDLAGISAKEQYVMAELKVSAYGREGYTDTFDPCDKGIKALCPSESSPNLGFPR